MPEPIYIKPGDSQNFLVTYFNPAKRAELEAAWKHFNRFDPSTGKTWFIWYRNSSNTSDLVVDYRMPANAQKGRYRIEVYIPGKNATTSKALFAVAHNFRVENNQPRFDDSLASINMFDLFDVWVPIGEFDLDPAAQPLSGRVRQFNLTAEAPPTRIAFSPVRWIPLFPGGQGSSGGEGPVVFTPRFDIPVGTAEQRSAPIVEGMRFGEHQRWLADWYDFTPFLFPYSKGYHTGSDLNSTISTEADRHAPIFAAADGKVTFCGDGRGSWGNIILIEHPDALVRLPNGSSRRQKVYTRYGHVTSDIQVQKNQIVKRGDHIGFIGLMAGASSGWHLHFDVCYGTIFATVANHWPDTEERKRLQALGKAGSPEWNAEMVKIKQVLLANYVDPFTFLRDNH
jgi:murein DD-endopeptidase MepM/ murein hydrolase activator NlpD